MSRLNILFMARRFPPVVGGMERFAYDLSSALDVDNKLIKITWGGANKWLPVILPIFFIRGLWALMSKQIDVIHMQDGVLAPIGWLFSKLSGKPYIVVAHGLDVTYENRFYQAVNVSFIRKANAIIAISTATMEEVLKRGVNAEKVSVITIGVHDDYVTPTPNRKLLQREIGKDINNRLLLLTTGRLVKRKGVAWFVQYVLPGIVREYPNALYVIAGEGEQRHEIESWVAKMKLDDNVLMLGLVSNEQRALLYQSSDVFVMPNIKVVGDMEGFGIVALEAATAALPIVASNLEGIRDAIKDGKNGRLVTSEKTDEFVTEILHLLSDKELREALGKKARTYSLREYSWVSVAKAYTAVYDKLLKSHS